MLCTRSRFLWIPLKKQLNFFIFYFWCGLILHFRDASLCRSCAGHRPGACSLQTNRYKTFFTLYFLCHRWIVTSWWLCCFLAERLGSPFLQKCFEEAKKLVDDAYKYSREEWVPLIILFFQSQHFTLSNCFAESYLTLVIIWLKPLKDVFVVMVGFENYLFNLSKSKLKT